MLKKDTLSLLLMLSSLPSLCFSHSLFSIPFSFAVSLPPHLSHILTQLHTSPPSYPGTHYSTVHIMLRAFNTDSYFLSQQQLRPLPSCPPPHPPPTHMVYLFPGSVFHTQSNCYTDHRRSSHGSGCNLSLC